MVILFDIEKNKSYMARKKSKNNILILFTNVLTNNRIVAEIKDD